MRNSLLTSSVASTRLKRAAAWLDGLDDAPEVRLIAPTGPAGDDFRREYLSGGTGAPGRIGVRRSTLLGLARELASAALAGSGRVPVGGVALEALVARTAALASADGELGYFDAVAGTLGFGRALGRTLAELRLEGIRPEELEDRGPAERDLSRLLSRYQGEMRAAGLADPAEVFEAAAGTLATSPERLGPVLLLDVWPRCLREETFIEVLVSRAVQVTAILPPEVGPGIAALARTLRIMPEVLPEDSTINSLNLLRKFVFTSGFPTGVDRDSSVEFFSATDEGRESVEIARHIQLAAARGTPFDRIAILLRNAEAYQPLIEDALERAGIPGYFTHGSLRPNPAGRAFLALLAAASERLSASRFAEYLSLGQAPSPATAPPDDGRDMKRDAVPPWVGAQGELFPAVDPPPAEADAGDTENTGNAGGDPRAPFHWEHLLGEAAVIGGRERWARRLSGLREELERRSLEIGGDDDAHREYLGRQIGYLDELRRFALPLVDRLALLPVSARWGEWLDQLEVLAALSLAEPVEVLAVLAELRPMSDVGPVTDDEVHRVLTERLHFLRSEPPERRYGKVFVGTTAEAACRAFDLVFLPGVAEGVFPRKSIEDPLLLDACREIRGRSMTRQADRSRDERLLLHLAAGAADRALLVSYPRMDIRRGRSRVPSFYALDILRAVEGRIPELGDLERDATRASMSRLGWPSPVDSAEAIDDAEYDLATIGDLVERRIARSDLGGGRGHYLIGANPHLARSLRTRARRWRKRWSGADGIVDPDPETLALLAAERPTARSYSATALETFASCPYRFLLHAVHKLHPMEEAAAIEQLDPLTRGGLFHSIQFRALTELRAAGLLPVTPANRDQVRQRVDLAVDTVARESYETLAPAIDRIWSNQIEALGTDLRGWIRQLSMAEDSSDWTPAYFEFTFGMEPKGDHDPASTDAEVVVFGNIRLRGSIDLVEAHAGSDLLRITDHKTGRAPAKPVGATGGGEVLQPMLYAAAAEAVFGRRVATSCLSYCTERGEYRRIDIDVDDRSRGAAEDAVRLIDQSIAEGFLPAAPRENACLRCDYRVVCGPYEERRTSLKRPDDHSSQVDRLRRLRR